MVETPIERYPSRVQFMKDRIDFDPKVLGTSSSTQNGRVRPSLRRSF